MGKRYSLLKGISLTVLLLLALFVPEGRAEWIWADPPSVSTGWALYGVHMVSGAEGWAVGEDFIGNKGVLLHWINGSWTLVTAPDPGSTDWGIRGGHFTSATEGWVVGTDYVGKKGVLLHYLKGTWTKVDLSGTVTVSNDWGLSAVHFTSATEGWAVGTDFVGKKGVLLQYLKGTWTKVSSPSGVSNDWSLESIYMNSSSDGWAVGRDAANNKGVILRYTGSWAKVTPANPTGAGKLSAVRFRSSSEGWAVGQDAAGNKGVILHYASKAWNPATGVPEISGTWTLSGLHFLGTGEGWAVGENTTDKTGLVLWYDNDWEVMELPSRDNWSLAAAHFSSAISGWAVGQIGQGTASQKGVLIRYVIPEITPKPSELFFKKVTRGANKEMTVNVKNTGTGNLSIGTIEMTDPAQPFYKDSDACSNQVVEPQKACKVVYRFSPTADGDFTGNSSIPSNAPANNPALIKLYGTGQAGEVPTITLESPGDGDLFSACSYYGPPTFKWALTGSVKGLEIWFSTSSDFATVPVKIKVKEGTSELALSMALWKKVLALGDPGGVTVYWRMVGTLPDKTYVESDVSSLTVEEAQAVGSPQLSPVSQGGSPTLSWQNNCSTKFKVWFSNTDGSASSGTKKKALSFKVKNPLDNSGAFSTVLSASQWKAVRSVVKDKAGETIYWYAESWDVLKRQAETGVQQFVLEP